MGAPTAGGSCTPTTGGEPEEPAANSQARTLRQQPGSSTPTPRNRHAVGPSSRVIVTTMGLVPGRASYARPGRFKPPRTGGRWRAVVATSAAAPRATSLEARPSRRDIPRVRARSRAGRPCRRREVQSFLEVPRGGGQRVPCGPHGRAGQLATRHRRLRLEHPRSLRGRTSWRRLCTPQAILGTGAATASMPGFACSIQLARLRGLRVRERQTVWFVLRRTDRAPHSSSKPSGAWGTPRRERSDAHR